MRYEPVQRREIKKNLIELFWLDRPIYMFYSYVHVDRISFRLEKVLRGSSGTIINFNGASTVPRGGNRCENVSCSERDLPRTIRLVILINPS